MMILRLGGSGGGDPPGPLFKRQEEFLMIIRGHELLEFAQKNGVSGEMLEKLGLLIEKYEAQGVRTWLEDSKAPGTEVHTVVLRMSARGGKRVAYCYWVYTPVGVGKGWAWRLLGETGVECAEEGVRIDEVSEKAFYRLVAAQLYDEFLSWGGIWGKEPTYSESEMWKTWQAWMAQETWQRQRNKER